MTIFNPCDDIGGWSVGTSVILSADGTDYVTAPASVKAESLGAVWDIYLDNYPWPPLDWTLEPIVSFWVKVTDPTKTLQLIINSGDPEVPAGGIETNYLLSGASTSFAQYEVDLRTLGENGTTPDLLYVRSFRLRYTLQEQAGSVSIDQIELNSPAPPPNKGYIDVHAFADSTEVIADGVIVETGETFATPAILEVDTGNYVVRLSYGTETYDYPVTVLEGQTVPVNGQFTLPIIYHVLSVNSTPVSGVTFALRGGATGEMSLVTPWSGSLEEGTYEVEMPSNVLVGGDTYNFTQWADGPTNPLRTVNLIADVTLEAQYAYVEPPPEKAILEVHAYVDSLEVDASGHIVELNQDFQTGLTGITIEVDAGHYTIQLSYQGVNKEYTADVTEGQTLKIDGQMAAPPEPSIPILPLLLVGGVVLLSLSKKK